MDTQIKHWIIVLERVKTDLIYMPNDPDPALEKIRELIKEMSIAREEIEKNKSSIPDHADPNLMDWPMQGLSESEKQFRRQMEWNKTCQNVHCSHGRPDAI